MSVNDVIKEAEDSLKRLEEAKQTALKLAARIMLEATLPVEIKAQYRLKKLAKQFNINEQKITEKATIRSGKMMVDIGLTGKVQKAADTKMNQLETHTNYLEGVDSVK